MVSVAGDENPAKASSAGTTPTMVSTTRPASIVGAGAYSSRASTTTMATITTSATTMSSVMGRTCRAEWGGV